MKLGHTYGEKWPEKVVQSRPSTKVIYKGTFVSEQSLCCENFGFILSKLVVGYGEQDSKL